MFISRYSPLVFFNYLGIGAQIPMYYMQTNMPSFLALKYIEIHDEMSTIKGLLNKRRVNDIR